MAGVSDNYSMQWDTDCFWILEDNYGVYKPGTSTTAIRYIECEFDYDQPNTPREDNSSASRSVTETIPGRKTAGCKFKCYLMTADAVLTEPDAFTDILYGGGNGVLGEKWAGAVQEDTTALGSPTAPANPTTTVIHINSVDVLNWPVNSWAVFHTNYGRDTEMRRITGVQLNPTYVELTVSPALETAPAVGDTVTQGIGYGVKIKPNTSLSVTRRLSWAHIIARGVVPSKISFTGDGNSAAFIEIEGFAKDVFTSGSDVVATNAQHDVAYVESSADLTFGFTVTDSVNDEVNITCYNATGVAITDTIDIDHTGSPYATAAALATAIQTGITASNLATHITASDNGDKIVISSAYSGSGGIVVVNSGNGADELKINGQSDYGDRLYVEDAENYSGIGEIILVDSEQQKVTAIDTTNNYLTVERPYGATSAADHALTTEVTPYTPSQTTAGTPIRGMRGGFWVAKTTSDAVVSFDVQKFNFDINIGAEANNDTYGTDSAIGYFLQGMRDVGGGVTWYFEDQYLPFFKRMLSNDDLVVVGQWGRDYKYMLACEMNKVKFKAPTIPGTGKGVTIASTTFTAQAAVPEGEIYFGAG